MGHYAKDCPTRAEDAGTTGAGDDGGERSMSSSSAEGTAAPPKEMTKDEKIEFHRAALEAALDGDASEFIEDFDTGKEYTHEEFGRYATKLYGTETDATSHAMTDHRTARAR